MDIYNPPPLPMEHPFSFPYFYAKIFSNADHKPSIALIELLQCAGMNPSEMSDLSLKTIDDWAQQNLLRSGERWEKQTERFETLKPIATPLLRKLGFIDAQYPRFKDYQGAIVHGALLSTVRLRLHWLIELWTQGVRFTNLYFLSGQRPLQPELENLHRLLSDEKSPLKIRSDWEPISDIPKNECEMTQWVWNQSEIPEEMRKTVKVHFISAPMILSKESKTLTRPGTQETILAWVDTLPFPGRYLSVSNAPYIPRQGMITQINAKDYDIDPVGPSIKENEKIAIIFDELARFIHTLYLDRLSRMP